MDTWARVGRVLDWRCPGPILCTTVVTMTRILILDAGGCRILDHGASIGHNIVDTIATRPAALHTGTFVTVNPSNTFAVVARWSAAVLRCCGAVVLLFLRHPLAAADGFTRTPPQHNPTQLQLQLPETVRYLLSSSPKLIEILILGDQFGGNLWKYKIWVESRDNIGIHI